MARVGLVGLGRMGRPMSRHLLRAGHTLTVFDLDPAAVETLRQQGAVGAASLADLSAASEVVLVMVPADEDVLSTVAGLLPTATPGAVIAVCSTTLPATCVRAAELAAASGVGVVDAPVARGVRGAEAGELTVFAGGAPEHVGRCRPVLSAFAAHVFHMGPVGAGQVTKMVNNLVHWVEVVGIYEALRLGAACGVHPSHLREALLGGSVESRTLRELHLVGMAWPHKDLAQALSLAELTQVPLPLVQRVSELVGGIRRDDLQALFD